MPNRSQYKTDEEYNRAIRDWRAKNREIYLKNKRKWTRLWRAEIKSGKRRVGYGRHPFFGKPRCDWCGDNIKGTIHELETSKKTLRVDLGCYMFLTCPPPKGELK